MVTKRDRAKEFKKLNGDDALKKLQFLYKEIFNIADAQEKIMEQQKEIGQLLVNLLQEYKKIKDFNKKFLR